ncbi:MAG: ABC transporter ATP-binding protein [Syntrophomonadaceae bacterium]
METKHDVVMTVTGLSQKRGDREIIRNISFSLLQGECLGIFGLRGSGKTTLLHALAGIDRISSGAVEILGHDIRKDFRYKRDLGLVTQEPSLFKDLNVLENLDYIAVLKGCSQQNTASLIEKLELYDYLKKPINSLELGVYQRLSLACALLNNPKILIADEIIRDIDLKSHQLILKVIKSFLEAGSSCLWGFSNIEDVSLLNRLIWLEEGLNEILQPEEAMVKWNEIRKVFSDMNQADPSPPSPEV